MEYHENPPKPWDKSPFLETENRHERRKKKALERQKKGKRMKPVTLTEDEEREINIRLKNDGFLQKEAYCIMEYHCEKCHTSEFLWNSRDGVTPFIINCVHCEKGEMRHINWQGDKREVWHIPKKGERIFITMPNEVNDLYVRKRIEMYWENEQYPMREMFANKEEAFKKLSGDMQKEGEPFIITWGV